MPPRAGLGIVGLNFGANVIETQLLGGPAAPWFALRAVCDADSARARAATPFPAGEGLLLLAPPVHVWADRAVPSEPGGGATVALDLHRPLLGAVPVVGETWHFQLWFRDLPAAPGAPPTTNTSGGVTVLLE